MLEVLKENQQEEKTKIEKILLNEFQIEANVMIYGYDLRNFGIEKIDFNILKIISTEKYTEKFFNVKTNGRFKEFGIEHIEYICKNSYDLTSNSRISFQSSNS